MPPMITGHAIAGGVQQVLTGALNLEILYTIVIIFCSLLIYISTKKFYQLTGHQGIKYFRQAFLFFSIAYFIRISIKFIFSCYNLARLLDIPIRTLGIASLLLFMYFSTMAIFYLFYSATWKQLGTKKIFFFHAIAIAISLAVTLIPTTGFYMLINLALLVLLIATLIIAKLKSNKKSNIYITYPLIAIFWVLNIVDILVPNFVKDFQLIVYSLSAILFIIILYKVTKQIGAN